jgi:hypothetical protein
MRIFRFLMNMTVIATLAIMVALTGTARADSVSFVNNPGTPAGVTPGAASGFFDLNPTTGTITDWILSVTASSDGQYGSRTYNSADNTGGPTQFLGSNPNGDQVFSFEENFPGTLREELDLVVACSGLAHCATTGPYALVSGPAPFSACPNGVVCSGELFTVPETTNARYLGPGFLNTSTNADGTIRFTLGSGGGVATVPEPASVWLFASGLSAIAVLRRKIA